MPITCDETTVPILNSQRSIAAANTTYKSGYMEQKAHKSYKGKSQDEHQFSPQQLP